MEPSNQSAEQPPQPAAPAGEVIQPAGIVVGAQSPAVQPSVSTPGDGTAVTGVETYTSPAYTGGQVSNQQKTGKRRLPGKSMLAAALAVLVILGGSAAAYFGYYVPNKPENVLAKGLQNSLSQHQIITEGTADITSSGVSSKVDYTAKIDADSHSVDLNLNATVSGVKVPLDLISTKGNLYFKVGDLTSLEGVISQLIGGGSSEITDLENQINKDVANQWIEVDSTLIKEAKLDCLSGYPAPLSDADVQALTNSYKQKPFAVVTSHSTDTVNGASAYKYQLSIDDDKAAGLNLSSSAYFKKLTTCLNQGDSSVPANLNSLKDGDKTPITIWVDKKSKLIVKYASQSTAKDKSSGTEGSLSGTIKYQKVNIAAPSNAKPFMNLLNDLNLNSLFGSSDASTGQGSDASPTVQDTERKTDLNALETQLEVYFTDNGYYPTLASLNDPAWRAQNMKGFDNSALQDPDGNTQKLAAAPAKGVYSYVTDPTTCDNGTHGNCNSYVLSATLANGSLYTKQSLN